MLDNIPCFVLALHFFTLPIRLSGSRSAVLIAANSKFVHKKSDGKLITSPIYRTRSYEQRELLRGPIDGTSAGDCRKRCWGFFFFFLLLPIFIFPTSLALLPPRLLTLSTMHLLLLFLLCRQSVLLGMSFVHC